MPKEGLGELEWQDRFRKFAAGTFKFGVGQAPPKGSKHAKRIDLIKRCPAHGHTAGQTTLGGSNKRPSCKCSYHPKKTTPKKVCVGCGT